MNSRRHRTWISGYPIPKIAEPHLPPCTRCGQPVIPGFTICEQCLRDEKKEAQSHALRGER